MSTQKSALQGCSALTFPMPDDRLSALTAGLAGAIAATPFPNAAADGGIMIGRLKDDGLSQSWLKKTVAPWTVVKIGTVDEISIRLNSRVDAEIRAEIAARPGVETGGVIVGRFTEVGNTFQIVDVLPAPSDRTFAPDKFVLGTSGLREIIGKLVRDSHGSIHVLGTWHSHLVPVGPSLLDARTAALLALRQFLPVLLLIALPEGVNA